MTYYFEDLINGYEIKENVISEYYEEFKNDEYLGLYNNLIDAFKSCLINLMYSEKSELEIKKIIKLYINNHTLRRVAKKIYENSRELSFINLIINRNEECIYNYIKVQIESRISRNKLISIIENVFL